ncbi:MAG: hypothetical protein M9890_02305 [Thermomicrobiales bacterium]|nr:hypothetical protein [Thermomicrobiales bacterium]
MSNRTRLIDISVAIYPGMCQWVGEEIVATDVLSQTPGDVANVTRIVMTSHTGVRSTASLCAAARLSIRFRSIAGSVRAGLRTWPTSGTKSPPTIWLMQRFLLTRSACC